MPLGYLELYEEALIRFAVLAFGAPKRFCPGRSQCPCEMTKASQNAQASDKRN